MLEVDVDRMKGGKALEERYAGGPSHGYPWSIVLDSAGAVLVTSDAAEGNIGCPVTPNEAEHFFGMLTRTRQRLSDDELAALRAEHDEFARPLRERSR